MFFSRYINKRFFLILPVLIPVLSACSCQSAGASKEARKSETGPVAGQQLALTYAPVRSLKAKASVSGSVQGKGFQYLAEFQAAYSNAYPAPDNFSLAFQDVVFLAPAYSFDFANNRLTYTDHLAGESREYDMKRYSWQELIEIPLPMNYLVTFLGGAMPNDIVQAAKNKGGSPDTYDTYVGKTGPFHFTALVKNGIVVELRLDENTGGVINGIDIQFENSVANEAGRYFPQKIRIINRNTSDYLSITVRKVNIQMPEKTFK